MKYIKNIRHISNANSAEFTRLLRECIKEYQDDDLEVEIQYATTDFIDEIPAVVYSALVVGRK